MKKHLLAALSGALFAGLIALLKTYDIAAAGPDGSEIGFSNINQRVHDATGVNMSWYDVTDYIGYAAIAICAAFALAGLIQLIKRKSLLKVDREILSLGVLYIAVIGFYALFEKVVINYRPVIMPGETEPEASFPSSHTMLIVTVMIATMMVSGKYIKNKGLLACVRAVCIAASVFTVCGRLYSGVHWFTDIVGGVLLSAALLFEFSAAISGGDKNSRSGDADPGKGKPKLSEKDRVIDGYRCKH